MMDEGLWLAIQELGAALSPYVDGADPPAWAVELQRASEIAEQILYESEARE